LIQDENETDFISNYCWCNIMEIKKRLVGDEEKRSIVYLTSIIESLFDDEWKPREMDSSFLKQIGITEPKDTFFVAQSGSSIPTEDGKIAGICILRFDEKDAKKGYPINWYHYDIYQWNDNQAILVTSDLKREDHWYSSKEEWEKRVADKPPHFDEVNNHPTIKKVVDLSNLDND